MEVTVDDADTQIQYTTKLGDMKGVNWEPNYLCTEHCPGLKSFRGQVEAAAGNRTWHTTRATARQSNATLRFEGSRIAASFILFPRDLDGVDPESVVEAELSFYIDDQRQHSTGISWANMVSLFGDQSQAPQQADPPFLSNVVLFNQTVPPGPHMFRIEYDTGDATERDTSLALDFIQYTQLEATTTTSASPLSTVPSVDASENASENAATARILGPILGTFGFVMLLGCLFFYLWHRRRKRRLNRRAKYPSTINGVSLEKAFWSPPIAQVEFPEKARLSTLTVSSAAPTLSTLSLFSRPGRDLRGFSLLPERRSRSVHRSTFSALSYTSYEGQWEGVRGDVSSVIHSEKVGYGYAR